MADDPLRVALLYGGCSAEHEVSLRSARSVFEAMDKTKYEVIPVLIDQSGAWRSMPAKAASFDPEATRDAQERLVFSPDPGHKGFVKLKGPQWETVEIDVVFPVLHGTYGEDGTVQGLIELAQLPYVGCGVLASSVGMDKVMMKTAFREAGLQVGPFFWFLRSEWSRARGVIINRMERSNFPIFVKPANLGSSVGISKVADPERFAEAVELAARFDRKIIVEDQVKGRELEVSVLGNDQPVASLPGEIVPKADFYDFDEKYLSDTAELHIPAELPESVVAEARAVAVAAFKAVDGSGLGRVDMFLTADERLVVNEINTLPGFTSISMYPKLWEATGMPYAKLINRLVDLAVERHRDKQLTRTTRTSK